MNEQVKDKKGIEKGDGAGYNGTNVLSMKGVRMAMTAAFPETYIKDVTMEAFEGVMERLKAHEDAEVRKLAQAADACFLLWQLAGEESALAVQTVGEFLPGLIEVIYQGKESQRPTALGTAPMRVEPARLEADS